MKKTLITLLLIIASCMYSHAELVVVDGILWMYLNGYKQPGISNTNYV